MEVMNVGYYET